MDGATLQAKIYAGYAKGAAKTGLATAQYRPTSSANPIATGTLLASINVAFTNESMGYTKPNKYGDPLWWGILDGRVTRVGDYLKNSTDGTFFIAAQQTNLPILLVNCNRTVDIKRPAQQAGVGALGYGGDTDAGETALMTQWPCSILMAGKGDHGKLLPGDTQNPQWTVLAPAPAGVALITGDIIIDDLGVRYAIASAEKTDLGWRILAMQEQT